MKKLFFVLLLSFAIIVPISAQSSWDWITSYPAGNYPSNSCQSEGRVFYLGWPKTYFSTSDGGNSFRVNTPYRNITDTESSGNDRISFADSLHGILIDEEGVFKTADGGTSWDRAPVSGSLVSFGSKSVGWVYGGAGLFKTIDSGSSWEYINATSLSNIQGGAACIFALNKDSVWISKNYSYNNGGSICFSSDGGNNWVQQNSIASNTSYQVNYNDIKISNSGIGIAVGEILINDLHPHYISFIERTSDYGNTWQQISVDTTLSLKVAVSGNNDEWLIFGNNKMHAISDFYPIELKSSDAGLTWNYKAQIFNNYYYNSVLTAEYIKKDNVLLVSGYDGIYRSMNFGDSFRRLSNKNEIGVKGFALDKYSTSENQLAIAVSTGDSLIVSEDGGRNWHKKYINEAGSLSGKVTVADGVIFAGINNGLYQSTDSGNSWVKIYSNYYGILRLTAYDKNNVAILSYYGNSYFIIYTTDGGTNWTSTPYSQFSFDTQLMKDGKIFACGNYYDSTSNNHGSIYTSKDYGHNWHLIDTKYKMNKIRAINKNDALAISNYEIYRSTDSGESWSIIRTSNDYFTYFDNFAFKDSINGTLKIAYQLYNSNDAGLNWAKSDLSLPTWGSISNMEYNNFGDLIIVSGEGMCIYKNPDYGYQGKDVNEITEENMNVKLSQNYPNPFNPTTIISYTIPQSGFVQLNVYDMLGREVARLVNKEQQSGGYNIEFNASSLTSGVYFYRLKSGGFIKTKKLILLK